MEPLQRHHYNMKCGFGGDAKRLDNAGTLYSALSPEDKKALAEGFGGSVAQLYQQLDFHRLPAHQFSRVRRGRRRHKSLQGHRAPVHHQPEDGATAGHNLPAARAAGENDHAEMQVDLLQL